jgi:hypothetical protein
MSWDSVLSFNQSSARLSRGAKASFSCHSSILARLCTDFWCSSFQAFPSHAICDAFSNGPKRMPGARPSPQSPSGQSVLGSIDVSTGIAPNARTLDRQYACDAFTLEHFCQFTPHIWPSDFPRWRRFTETPLWAPDLNVWSGESCICSTRSTRQ